MRILATIKPAVSALAVAASLAAAMPSMSFAQELPPRVVGAVMVDELTTAPLQFEVEVELAATPADVFAYVADSANLPSMFPAISGVSVSGDGSMRELVLGDGTTVAEAILVNDSGAMSFAYGLPADNPMGLANHLAVMQVRPADERDGSVLAWQHYFDGGSSDEVMALHVEAANSLAVSLGGFTSGTHHGFDDVTLTQTRIFSVSAEAVWAEVAENYANAHEWASVIESIEFEDAEGGSIGDVRACFIPGLGGATREVITRYDEDDLTYAYTIDEGMPPFVTANEAIWSAQPIDENTSEVTVTINFSTAPGVPPQVIAFARANFYFFAGLGIEDLKYYLENGEVHPREIASRS